MSSGAFLGGPLAKGEGTTHRPLVSSCGCVGCKQKRQRKKRARGVHVHVYGVNKEK